MYIRTIETVGSFTWKVIGNSRSFSFDMIITETHSIVQHFLSEQRQLTALAQIIQTSMIAEQFYNS